MEKEIEVFKTNDYLECVDNTGYRRHLDIGESYVVLDATSSTVEVITEDNQRLHIPQDKFKLIKRA